MNAHCHRLPASLAELGLPHSLLIDLTLRHVYVSGEPSTTALARRMGLSVDLLSPLVEFMRRGGLVEPVDAGHRPIERAWGLTSEGRKRAAQALGRSRYVGAVPVTLEEYRLEVGQRRVRRPYRDALADLLGQCGFSGEQIDALGTGFAGEGLIFIHGPSGSGKTHLLNTLGQALEGMVRVPHAIAVGDRVLEVFDPDVHHPLPNAGGDVRADRRWVHCVPPVIRAGAEISVQMFDPRWDPVSGRVFAPMQIKANNGLLLIDDLDAAGFQARALIGRWRMLLESGIDRLRFPDGTAIEFPVSARMVVASSLAPEALGGEALVRRLAGRVDLDEWPESVYRQWVERLYRSQGCESPDAISTWLVGMHRSGGLLRLPGIPARLLQIAHDGAHYRGESGPLDRIAFERAWHVHRGLPGPAARRSDLMPRRGTIATPSHRRVSGSIDVRNRHTCHPA